MEHIKHWERYKYDRRSSSLGVASVGFFRRMVLLVLSVYQCYKRPIKPEIECYKRPIKPEIDMERLIERRPPLHLAAKHEPTFSHSASEGELRVGHHLLKGPMR